MTAEDRSRRETRSSRRNRLGHGAAIAAAFAIVASAAGRAGAQQARSAESTVQSTVKPEARPEKVAGDWVALPVVYYSPETALAFGVVGIYYFRLPGSKPDTRPSNFKGNFIYTTKNQFLAQISPQFYFKDEQYFLDTELSFVRFFDRFWGIGNDTPESNREEYTTDTYRARLGLLRRLPPYANFGLRIHYEGVKMLEFEAGKLIDLDPFLVGTRESLSTGFGIEFQYDSRDNYFSSASGTYVSAQALVFTRTLGGDATYLLYTLDARKFIPTVRGQVLALQAFFNSVTAGAPFTSLSQLGGTNRMRGLFDGRYRDLLAAIVQAEYRVPLFWRIGVVGFVAAGQVAPTLGAFDVRGFHLTGGGGLRVALKQEERIQLRIDVGFGGPEPSYYLFANEAF